MNILSRDCPEFSYLFLYCSFKPSLPAVAMIFLKFTNSSLLFLFIAADSANIRKEAGIMKFESSVVIHQPIKHVFEFVTNFKNNAIWQTDILELEMTSKGRFGPGSTYRCANRFMGKRYDSECIITDYVPNETCSIRIISGAVTGANSFIFKEVDGGTKFTAAGTLDLGYFKLAKLIVKRKINQQLKKDMHKLKEVLENGRKL